MKKYIISTEEYQAVIAAIKENRDKLVDRRLRVLKYRYEGMPDQQIAEVTGYHVKRLGQICKEYRDQGLEEFAKKKYGGNHRNLSESEEREILTEFEKKAEAGQMITVHEIKEAFDKRLGRDTGSVYVYMVLKRHHWRKIMPRARHPKKASEEAIEASKKLTTT